MARVACTSSVTAAREIVPVTVPSHAPGALAVLGDVEGEAVAWSRFISVTPVWPARTIVAVEPGAAQLASNLHVDADGARRS